MEKFYGLVGYSKTVKSPTSPGVWIPKITEVPYSGEILKNNNMSIASSNSSTNNDLKVSNRISILADPEIPENFQYIAYVVWHGAKWEVTNVEVHTPRLILTLGGVYNGGKS